MALSGIAGLSADPRFILIKRALALPLVTTSETLFKGSKSPSSALFTTTAIVYSLDSPVSVSDLSSLCSSDSLTITGVISANLCNIFDFLLFQPMRDKNENNPLLYLLQMTKTPFLDSSILNVMYSLNKGVNLKSKPNSFSFSTVIILHRNQGASDAGLILK